MSGRMVRRMTIHTVPGDLFGFWSGEIILDVGGVSPIRCRFAGRLESGFERTRDIGLFGSRERWQRCGAELQREIATRLCEAWLRASES